MGRQDLVVFSKIFLIDIFSKIRKGNLFNSLKLSDNAIKQLNTDFTNKAFLELIGNNADTKLKVSFDNIKINSDYQLIDGVVLTTYDPTWGNVSSVNEQIQAIQEIVNAIGELLNLDITRTTRERIQALISAFTSEINNEDLPDNIKKPLEQAISAVEQTSTSYYNAKERYDNASTDTEKEQAKKDMNAAEKDFKAAQTTLEKAENNRQEYIKEFQKLLKKAIVELYREGAKSEIELTKQYEKFVEQQKVNNEDIFYVFDYEEAKAPQDVSVSDELKKLNDLELAYGTYLFSKLLSTKSEDSIVFKRFIQTAKSKGTDVLSFIKQQKENNITNDKIVVSLKEKLRELFVNILLEENYNKYK